MSVGIFFLFAIIVIIIFLRKVNNTKVMRYLKYQYKFWVYYLWMLLVSICIMPVLALRPKNVNNSLILSECIKHVTRVIGVEWVVRNGKVFADDRGAVIVANHQSSLDILGKFNLRRIIGNAVVVSKKEVLYLFPFGFAIYLIGSIFISRKHSKEAFKELLIQADGVLNNNIKIWIYPEGTRNSDPTKMLPFKKGAFVIAVNSQVPIIPVVFSPYYFINEKQGIFGKGRIIVKCLEPVPTEGLTMDDVPDLIERVRGIMLSAYKDSAKEIQNNLHSYHVSEL